MPLRSNSPPPKLKVTPDSDRASVLRPSNRIVLRAKTVWAYLACCWLTVASLSAGELRFRHFTIANPLPGTAWGTAGIPLADLDGDGDLDAALSRRDVHGFWWYERRSDAEWVQHLICDSDQVKQSLGATALDVDQDGWTDLVFSFVWFKNPGTLREHPDAVWPRFPFPGDGHDLLPADVNGDGRPDIVTFDGKEVVWFDTARSLARHVVAQGIGHHGGLTPRGVGDLDGDGDLDLVIAGFWFENPGPGNGTWPRHSWPHLKIPNASYGTSIRSWVTDLDGDGALDIVYSDCDTGSGHVYWVKNLGGGRNWTRSQLPDPPTEPGNVPGTGSWHSLGVADFDGDGDLDVFAGEQEDPDAYMVSSGKLPMKPKGLKERGVIWIHSGPKRSPTFTPQVIQVDNPGWHDASLGDVDGDGDVDIVSKIWNKDGPAYHADYWRNDTVRAKGSTP
jgi:FG-GAP-like repeat